MAVRPNTGDTLAEDGGGNNREGVGIGVGVGVGKTVKAKGDRKPGRLLRALLLQVTGDSHRSIGDSGVGLSAVGHRLLVPAADSRTAGA